MKCALLVEHDPVAGEEIAALLKSLGYIVATTDNPRAALNTAQTVRFDLVLTYTTFNADDRRSFTGELARLAPGAAVVLLLADDAAGSGYHQRSGALLFKPVTLRSLRRVLDFGVDGLGMHPAWIAPEQERRRPAGRRQRPR